MTCGRTYDNTTEKISGESKMKNHAKNLINAANWIVKICGGVIFLFLLWYSFRYTHHLPLDLIEITQVVQDHVPLNLLFPCVGLLLFGLLRRLEKNLHTKVSFIIANLAVAVASLWVLYAGFKWIYSADRYPITDPLFSFAGASYFIEGNYSFLTRGGYCSVFPHQLGLISFMELFFRIAGPFQYFRFEILCVFFAVGIVWLGHLILWRCCASMSAAVIYSCAISGCIPLIIYTSWVYGDIPCIFFTMLAVWFLLCYDDSRKIVWLACTVLSATLACIVRKNALIFIIAMCLAALVSCFQKKDRKLLTGMLFALILPLLSYQGIYKMYELRSGLEHSKGLPTLTWIAIGMTEDPDGQSGVYVDDFRSYYYECGHDLALVKEKVVERIRDRIAEMKADPSYAVRFYREKILLQWNDPLYGCFYFNTQYSDEAAPAPDSWAARIAGELYEYILVFSSQLQAFIYLGVFFYFVLAFGKDSSFLRHTLAITFIGSFLFSILWEAKARYIFSYYPLMFPVAIAGYLFLLQRLDKFMARAREGV